MTDENIIKALEICVNGENCRPCPVDTCNLDKDYSDCEQQLHKEALGYINRLKQENENLTVENEVLNRDVQNLERTLEEANDELKKIQHDYNMELQEHSEYIKGIDERVLIGHANVRKETAKEILLIIDSIPTNEVNELNHLYLLKQNIYKKYGVKVEE